LRSRTVDLGGPVHFTDSGERSFEGTSGGTRTDDPVIVCIHGLGGSHVNWIAVEPALARRARVLAVDLPGFGRTPLAGRHAGIQAHHHMLDRFLAEVVGVPAILMGMSMGGTIAILEASSQPERVAGLILVCPSVPGPGMTCDREVARRVITYVIPGLSDRIMRRRRQRLGPEALFHESLRTACVDPRRIPQWALDAMLDFAYERNQMPWADTAYLQAARSLVALHTKGKRRFFEAIQRVKAPTLLVQGAADRLAPLTSARQVAQARPDWEFMMLDKVGHLPMLEDPERLTSIVDAWLSALTRATAGHARSAPERTHEGS
jgi:pimeloyl-ACP methyl ester carboxylesterase